MTHQNIASLVPANTGPSYWGPGGDRYTFFVSGAQTNGAYSIFEALVPPGGGPPPHVHHREEEDFYILEGTLDLRLGEKQLKVLPEISCTPLAGLSTRFAMPEARWPGW